MRQPQRLATAATAAILAVFSAPSGLVAAAPNWNAVVTLTPQGTHVIGNPRAKVKLAEYISYTCSHCAHFTAESAAPLATAYVGPGKVSVEVRHYMRDPIDATVAQLANCGSKDKFFGNHKALLAAQSIWMKPLASATEAQKQRWMAGDYAARRRAIAMDLGLYGMMAKRGYTKAMLDRCLADDALARRLAAQTAAGAAMGLKGTPSFAIDNALLPDTYAWDTLKPQLDARL